jgi:hypothetical protein
LKLETSLVGPGGPIVKNKLFFFGGYQNTILRSDPANNQHLTS